MDKKEFYKNVDAIVRTAIAARIATQTELDEVMGQLVNSRKYSADHIQNVLRPKKGELEKKLRRIADDTKFRVEKMTAAYIAELEAENHLDGAALTDDAQLLSVGVLLRDVDLEKMFDKHAGNFTMQKLITDYAKQNNISIKRTLLPPNGNLIQTLKSLPYTADRCVGWHTRTDFYEQFMGENSELAQYMNG